MRIYCAVRENMILTVTAVRQEADLAIAFLILIQYNDFQAQYCKYCDLYEHKTTRISRGVG
jgi:hypothetical protein